jgi:hypothetical protein
MMFIAAEPNEVRGEGVWKGSGGGLKGVPGPLPEVHGGVDDDLAVRRREEAVKRRSTGGLQGV